MFFYIESYNYKTFIQAYQVERKAILYDDAQDMRILAVWSFYKNVRKDDVMHHPWQQGNAPFLPHDLSESCLDGIVDGVIPMMVSSYGYGFYMEGGR